jgi:hypothetical protein
MHSDSISVAQLPGPRARAALCQNGYLSSRGGCQSRWYSRVSCGHGDSTARGPSSFPCCHLSHCHSFPSSKLPCCHPHDYSDDRQTPIIIHTTRLLPSLQRGGMCHPHLRCCFAPFVVTWLLFLCASSSVVVFCARTDFPSSC